MALVTCQMLARKSLYKIIQELDVALFVCHIGKVVPVCFLVLVSGAISVRCCQAAGDRPCQHGPYRDPVETSNRPLIGGNVYLELHPQGADKELHSVSPLFI